MSLKHNRAPEKTIGSQMARLLAALSDQSKTMFSLKDAAAITGLRPGSAGTLLHKAAKRGLLSHVKRDLFVVVPSDFGSGRDYAGNPFLIARQLAGNAPYFMSHATAMEIHRMVTQPQLAIFISSAKRLPRQTLQGTEFRFILIKTDQVFGTTKHWVSKQESVEISDLERTVIDGLRHPHYCGGVTEVAKGLWMRRQDMQIDKLVAYALRLGTGAVLRRLGFLLEQYGLGSKENVAKLQEALTPTYLALDPNLPKEGPYLKRWRLQVNITPEELEGVREG